MKKLLIILTMMLLCVSCTHMQKVMDHEIEKPFYYNSEMAMNDTFWTFQLILDILMWK